MRKIGYLSGYVPRGRYISKHQVPFQELLPLKLRNQVSGKGDKSNSASCIQEMQILFACLRKNDFTESPCSQEISSFQKCHDDHLKQKKLLEEREKQGLLVPGQKKLSHKQATELLKRYPNV